MNKPAVFIDVDDTLAQMTSHFLEWTNAQTIRQFAYYELDISFREGAQPEYEEQIQKYLSKREYVEGILPYHDALESIKRLHEAGYSLHIVTARESNLHSLTEDWLKEHGFIDYIDQIHPRVGSVRPADFKRDIATQLKPVATFDDTYDVGLAIAETGSRVYLLDRPWNAQSELHPNMRRARTFSEAVDDFLITN